MPNIVIVNLTSGELRQCEQWAQERFALMQPHQNFKVSQSHGDYDIHDLGVKAEYAVCKYFRRPIQQYHGQYGDGGEQDIWLNGKKIQVKATRAKTGHLLFRDLEAFRADYGVLVIEFAKGQYWIVGQISRTEFIEKHQLKDFGYGKEPCVSQDLLKHIEELKGEPKMAVKIIINHLRLSQKEGKLKAFASVDIAGKIELFGCKLMDGEKGMWVAYSQRKGNDGKWYDNVRVKDDDLKRAITDAYLEAYKKVSRTEAGADEGDLVGDESSEF